MKTVAIIQARLGSTRLPGKVLKELCGQSVLAHVIARVKACSAIDEVVVATTTAPRDATIAEEAVKCGVKYFRGSEEDVLARYYLAAKEFHADTVVRVTADDPLIDFQVLDRMLEFYTSERAQGRLIDYLSNNFQKRSYPLGLDAEIISMSALEKAHREAEEPYDREHVSPYIYKHPDRFALRNHLNLTDLSAHRWTLDTQEDWVFISEIYSALHKTGNIFSTKSVLDLLESKPDLMKINAHVKQQA